MPDRQYRLEVTVQPRYLPDQSDPSAGQYAFAYTVRVTNAGTVPTQLISRHWVITDGNGKVVEVKGLGVVGHQPLLAPGQSFEYTSGSQIAMMSASDGREPCCATARFPASAFRAS